MKIRNTAEIVKEILEQKPRARDCDFVLYGFVLNKYGYSVSIPFNELANLVKAEELPSMETVGRARRKVMELYPALRGDSYKVRIDNTAEYIEFAQDKSV